MVKAKILERLSDIQYRLDGITPGEWELTGRLVSSVIDDKPICGIIASHRLTHEDQNNATFIAWAPDDIRWLLEVLNSTIEVLDG